MTRENAYVICRQISSNFDFWFTPKKKLSLNPLFRGTKNVKAHIKLHTCELGGSVLVSFLSDCRVELPVEFVLSMCAICAISISGFI